ncbi:MAG: hypothetical protein Harvfovirus34_16 [Harvfovirus sp.]|uniref:Uncharacterized protein n=1 Tax=Harvfovirus sp. TaxID=2487768 RepID=A0A3G5A5E1_9VIRU|nr:MAG: hypothetical protein Harvfovirus34_16 [Harvfovirus sp.]
MSIQGFRTSEFLVHNVDIILNKEAMDASLDKIMYPNTTELSILLITTVSKEVLVFTFKLL